jgi:hypothetical protein
MVEEGLMAFREIGDFGRPIVHLDVDVYSVFGTPDWHKMLVPNALKV